MIKQLGIRIRKSDGIGLMHDSRRDVQTLAEACNYLVDKVNELVIEVNRLNKEKGSVSHE